MGVVGRGDDDRVHGCLLEQLPRIAVDLDLSAVGLATELARAFVGIRDRRHLGTGDDRKRRLEVRNVFRKLVELLLFDGERREAKGVAL